MKRQLLIMSITSALIISQLPFNFNKVRAEEIVSEIANQKDESISQQKKAEDSEKTEGSTQAGEIVNEDVEKEQTSIAETTVSEEVNLAEKKVKTASDETTKADVVDEGVMGTSHWWLLNDGTIYIGDGQINKDESPWQQYKDTINKISFYNYDTASSAKVTTTDNIDSLFADLGDVYFENMTSFDTSGATSMARLFKGTTVLNESIELKSFLNTANVESMASMFNESQFLNLDITGLDTSKVTNADHMFEKANINTLNMSDLDFSSLTNMTAMFRQFKGERLLANNLDTHNVLDMTNLFYNAMISEASIDQLDTSSVVNMSGMFNKSMLKGADVTGFNTGNVTDMSYMFEGAYGLKGERLNYSTGKVTSMLRMFASSDFENLDLSGFDTANVTDMSGMFQKTNHLQTLNLSGLETAQDASMNAMFQTAVIEKVNITGLDTSSVADMGSMFAESNITEINLAELDTGNVTDMSSMFSESKFPILNLLNFDTSKVTTMNYMFQKSAVKEIDFSSFDMSNVKDAGGMFSFMSGIRELDLSPLDTSNVTEMGNMLYGMSLGKIILGPNSYFKGIPAPRKFADDPRDGVVTGNWIAADNSSKAYTPEDFAANYGTGDLQPGVYIADLKMNAQLDIDLSFSKDSESIAVGDDLVGTIKIIHTGEAESVSDATDIKLETSIMNDEFLINGNGTVEKFDKDGNSLSESKLTEFETASFSTDLGQLAPGESFTVTLPGKVWNNISSLTDEGQSKIKLSFDNGESSRRQEVTNDYYVNNGSLAFDYVPDILHFEKVQLDKQSKDVLVDRLDPDWKVVVSDLRGTNTDEDNNVARQNWELSVKSKGFVNEKNEAVSLNTMSVAFIDESGKQWLLDNENAVVMEEHRVRGETPLNDNQIAVFSEKEQGLKTIVHNSIQLKSDEVYRAQLDLELTVAP